MAMTPDVPHELLKTLPGIDHLLACAKDDERFTDIPRSVLLETFRTSIDQFRKQILAGNSPDISDSVILDAALHQAQEKIDPNLVTIINATGVVLHTNLGRALLCEDALENIAHISRSYSNLELKIKTGKRGIRYEAIDELICELTGAQSAIAVNNNASAVLLALNTIAQNREVVVSRGELVEIGGSFRIPDVMVKSGCVLKEVGTTNRTHPKDYDTAVNDNTGLFLKVHASNYKIEGFTKSVSLNELAGLGNRYNIPVMEDLGSGTLIDFSKYGMPFEPTVADSVQSGADIITFSGDKLLGGPQAGIIVGKKEYIDQIKSNPMTRALRIDKMTLAALESTLSLYRDEKTAIEKIPTLRMLTMPYPVLRQKAENLMNMIKDKVGELADVRLADMNSQPGGGSFPQLDLPTCCVTIQPEKISVSALESAMRLSTPGTIARIEDDQYIMDPRTIQDGQDQIIASTLTRILQ